MTVQRKALTYVPGVEVSPQPFPTAGGREDGERGEDEGRNREQPLAE